ncbi:MAG: DUF58 domain-containing protein [Actinomycetales bacterium]|nr:DUF58 domain-containing protein [Actinomycetales bacterium]
MSDPDLRASTSRESSRETRSDAPDAPAASGEARTRLVGSRTGVLADAVVTVVESAGRFGRTAARAGRAAAAVVMGPGWVFLLLIPAAFVAGYLFGWIELVIVAWAALVLAVVAVVYLVGRSPAEVSLALTHHRVVVGETAQGVVEVRNPRRRRILGSTLEVPVGDGLAELVVPGIRGGRAHSQSFTVPTARRGLVRIGPVRSVRADPIGLVRRELIWSPTEELLIHPRTVTAPSTSTGLIHDLEGQTTRDLSASDMAFHALREYQPGDERRFIHWKSTAKTGTYMVRQFEQTRRSHLVVALSLAPGDFATVEEFELGVSVAASLGVRAIRDGRTVSVVVSTITPPFAKRQTLSVRHLATHTPMRLLDEMALVEPASGALPLRDVARVVADEVPGISVAFLVCGSSVGIGRLRAAATSFPANVEVVAIVCDPESEPGLRRAAGINLLQVGFLDDLRTGLARGAAVA